MRILGIDPGLATVGYGVIDTSNNSAKIIDYNSITTPPKTQLSERLNTIYNKISNVIKKHKPDEVAIEEIFFAKNMKTGIQVSEARGVIVLACHKCGLTYINEYTPLEVKIALTGYGRADKNQVQQMVKAILGLKEIPKPDDVADALAVAISHFHTQGNKKNDRIN